jgi:hypothetical protein
MEPPQSESSNPAVSATEILTTAAIAATTIAAPVLDGLYRIKSIKFGTMLTRLSDGKIVLAAANTNTGGNVWRYVKNANGWYGFRYDLPGGNSMYLGHDDWGFLRCTKWEHNDWERCSIEHATGGYFLNLTEWEHLWPVAFKEDHGENRLAKVNPKGADALVWEFVGAWA